MATITSTIKLVDQMTPTLNKISKAIDRVNAQSKAIGSAKTWNGFNSGVMTATRSTHNLYNALRRAVFMLGALRGLQGLTNIADTMMNANARINNITGDLAKTKYYMDAIYQSAQRSRSGFMETANSVGKLATLAGSAFEGSMEQVIAFTELMNKMFVISGASAAESSNAMYQLTQAMAAGKLQGDEMRSILENAPMLAQKLAEKLGVSVGELKELGAEGKITADIIKDALFASAEEIEEKFNDMPKTIGQTWTEICNHALNAFRPVIDRVQKFINSPTFENFKNRVYSIITAIANGVIRLFNAFESPRIQNAISKICAALGVLWDIVLDVGQVMVNVATWICDNWNWIAPIIYTIAWAFLIYKAAIAIATVAMWAYNAAQFVAGLIAGTVVLTTFGWVMLIIIAIVAVIYLAVAAWNHFTGSTVSATGIIFGAVAFVIACLWDLVVGLWDVLGTCVDAIVYLAKLLWQIFVDLIELLSLVIYDIVAFCVNLIAAVVTAVVECGTRLWDTFVWILEICKVVLTNIGKFILNLVIAIGKSFAEICIQVANTFKWIGAVIETWAGNIKSGMSQLCEQLPLYWELFKSKTVVTFWSLVLNAGRALNSLLSTASDICKKMIQPFEGFANAVIDCFNCIIRGWNWLCEQLTFTLPALHLPLVGEVWGDTTISLLGGGVNELDHVSWTDWESPSIDLRGVASELQSAQSKLEGIKSQITDINWSSTPLPEYSDYVNWGAVSDAWNEGMNSFEYDALPEYTVNWDGVWGQIKDAFNLMEYENPLDAFAGDDYKQDWAEFMAALDKTWNSKDYVNPIEAFKDWYKKGETLENGVTGLIDGIGALLGGLFGGGSATIPGNGEIPGNEIPKSLEDLIGGYDPSGVKDALGNIADNTGSTAGSAGNIEDTLDLAEEELELLRKLAEQEVINRFTTAEIHVDMTNNNNVSSNMDLDGIVTHLSNKLYEELGVVASGVHY